MKDEGGDFCEAQDSHKKLLQSFPPWFLAIKEQTNNNNDKSVSPEEYSHPQKEPESLKYEGVAILAMNQTGMNCTMRLGNVKQISQEISRKEISSSCVGGAHSNERASQGREEVFRARKQSGYEMSQSWSWRKRRSRAKNNSEEAEVWVRAARLGEKKEHPSCEGRGRGGEKTGR